MNEATRPIGILIVSHGSPRAEANERFVALTGRIAARLGVENLLPAFFSIARPNIADRVAELADRGVRRIVLLPYFLYTGQHVTHDIPVLLDQCRGQFPAISFEVLPTLESDPALEDLVVERLAAACASPAVLPTLGEEIQRRSYQIIAPQLDAAGLTDAAGRKIVERVVHATADFSFIRSLRIHPEAVRRGRDALAAGRPVLCDVTMLQAGMTHVRNEVVCAIADPQVAALAAEKQCTRAAAAMELLAPGWPAPSWPSATPPRRWSSCWKSSAAAGRGRRWWWACPWGWSARGRRNWRFWRAICVTSPTSRPVAAAPPRPRPSTRWPPKNRG